MIKLMISLLLITSVSFADTYDPNNVETVEMSRVKDITSDCPNCIHSGHIANNHACLVEGLCADGQSSLGDTDGNKGTN